MEEKRENGLEPDNTEQGKRPEENAGAGFYAGELPDPLVRAAYDPFNGQDPATLLAQLIGEEKKEEKEKPQRSAWLGAAFGGLLAILCAAAILLRAPEAYPPPAATPSPTPKPTPTASASIKQEVLLPVAAATNAPAAPMEASYVRTALVVDGRVMGVLVSSEAAETLLRDVCAHFEAQVRENYEIGENAVLETELDNEIELRPAPETPDEELCAAETLFETLSAKNTRLDVISTEKSSVEEIVEAETKETDDKYLLKGTSIIEDPGCDGSILTVHSVTYKNGKKRKESEEEDTTEKQARTRIVRVGTQKIKDGDEPGKREGKKGKEAEGLRFISPLEDGKIISNYGQRGGVLHLGLDYSAEQERPRVLAACAGTVVCKMERGGYGLMVEIDHGQGFVTRYAHLEEAPVNVGDEVGTGEAIGIMGKSGNADSLFLHFELRIDGEAYNPRYYLE